MPKRNLLVKIEKKITPYSQHTGVNLLRSRFLYTFNNARPPIRNLTPGERAVLCELKSDNVAVVLTTDNEKGTLIMNRVDYDNKILNTLNDPAHIVKLARNCAPKV